MTAVVRVPTCDLVGRERELTAEELRELLERYGQADPEAGHGLVDDLMRAAMAAIRDGHPQPQQLAEAVLTATSADFPRWCA